MTKYILPPDFKVYVGSDKSVLNHPAPGYVEGEVWVVANSGGISTATRLGMTSKSTLG